MFIEQYIEQARSDGRPTVSWMIADEETRQAFIVDPLSDVEPYLEAASARGYELRHVFLTRYPHPEDSGHVTLREREGVQVYLGAGSPIDLAYEPVAAGCAMRFGSVKLRFRAVPGASGERSIEVYDLAQSESEPRAVIDSLRERRLSA